MNFEQKYLKYKNKYNSLKESLIIGGDYDVPINSPCFKITIKTRAGWSRIAYVTKETLVSDVKRLLMINQQASSISIFKFIYKGTEIENNNTLEHYGITEETTINLILVI